MSEPITGVSVDPDRACPHENFWSDCGVARITKADDDPTIIAFAATIKIHCVDCRPACRLPADPQGDTTHVRS